MYLLCTYTYNTNIVVILLICISILFQPPMLTTTIIPSREKSKNLRSFLARIQPFTSTLFLYPSMRVSKPNDLESSGSHFNPLQVTAAKSKDQQKLNLKQVTTYLDVVFQQFSTFLEVLYSGPENLKNSRSKNS